MIYLFSFLFGVFCGSGAILFIRLRNTRRIKKYGFTETQAEKPMVPFVPDADSKLPEAPESVDGSRALKDFKN